MQIYAIDTDMEDGSSTFRSGNGGESAITTNIIGGKIQRRQRPHIADVVGDKHGISGTQNLPAEVELSLLSAQPTKGSEVLLGPHNLHKLGLLNGDGVPQEIC
jgi:hypothetical protein